MAIAILERTQTVYPQLENGAQIAPLGDEVRRVALCGSSGAIQDQLAFVCQYVDATSERVLLLNELGVFHPRHNSSSKEALRQLPKFTQKIGLLDVLTAATFGPQAECYAAAWNGNAAALSFGYQRIFVTCGTTVDPWASYAVLFRSKKARENAKLLQQLYDLDTMILGVATIHDREG